MKLRDSLAAVGDLLLPRTCLVCGRVLTPQEKHICLYCSTDLPRTWYWLREHNPMADRLNECIQRRIDRSPEPRHEEYSRAAALFFYHSESPYSAITKALKYHSDIPAGRYFASILGRRLAESPLFADVDAVVPVPLHPLRRWKRGFNQASVIASAVAAELPLHPQCFPALLKRTRRTRTQTRLSIEQKRSNVSGAFSVVGKNASRISPHHILLIDDVFTTGATLGECHAALRAFYGPSVRISVATLACVGE